MSRPSSARGRYQHERSQNERLPRALRESPRGIDPLDWLNEPAPDGGHRVTRCASRIRELRSAGHPIETIRRGRATLYRLTEATGASSKFDPSTPAGPTLDPGPFERAVGTALPRYAVLGEGDA